jgi:gas vesicle protein
MTEHYDRTETGANGFIVGLFAGTLIGAGLGLLLAPKSGAEMRRQLRSRAGDLADAAEDTYRRAADTATDYAQRGRDLGRDVYDRSRETVSKAAEEVEGYARETGVSDPTRPPDRG